MRRVVAWVLSRAGLYVLLLAALVLGPLVVELVRSDSLRSELMSPGELAAGIERLRVERAAEVRARALEIRDYPASRIDMRLEQARAGHAEAERRLQAGQGWFASIRPKAILERKQAELQRAALGGEIRLLEALREERRAGFDLARVMAPTPAALAVSLQICERARAEARRFDARHVIDRSVRNVLSDEAQRLRQAADQRCEAHRRRVDARRQALERVEVLRDRVRSSQSAYAREAARAEDEVRNLPSGFGRTVRGLLVQAGILLAVIVATPYLIRLFFYFVLAPLAERRPSVRLSGPPGRAPGVAASAGASATSVAVRLGPQEELLVRQGFLQSVSIAGDKSTRALLDWRHPLSSLASGLIFLTRIRGDGATATVSALRDPLAEVVVLELPVGAACVLQPRALAGVVQPVGRPVRITTHWRLGSLHAWLTLQLRYLMFHGPARLVIKGGRGIRVERVERGLVFGQDQLVGFSVDLTYAVARAETFWPYFFGIEPLLKDRVEGGGGLLILEEVPLGGGGRTRPRRGLEGAADALLKVVGL